MRRTYDLTKNVHQGHHKIWITSEAKEDLKLWRSFLQNFNGTTIIRAKIESTSSHINMFSDSCLTGFGATFGSNYITGRFPDSWQKYSITVLETYPVLAIIGTFCYRLRNSHINFHTDNMGVAYILNKQTSKNQTIMIMIRKLVLILLENNITLTARHIPGNTNYICDLLSRKQVPAEVLREQGLKVSATPIPPQLLPENLI